jgi:restriction system protein
MAVPDFQSLMLPLLETSREGRELSMEDARNRVAPGFNLSEADLAERMDSGARTYANRIAWAKIHLERAGLLEKTRRGWFQITDAGREVLAERPERIDLRYLSRFPGSLRFRNRSDSPEVDDIDTPRERLENAYGQIRAALAEELLGQVQSASPAFLEKVVVDLMLRMGYGGVSEEAGIVTPLTGDEGIDGIINEDRLGLDVIYLQAKRWERPVGRPEIQKFVGALHGKRARKGVCICTSSFTADAVEYCRTIDPKVVLIDGIALANLMIDFNVGVSVSQMFEIKQLDSDYFTDEQ